MRPDIRSPAPLAGGNRAGIEIELNAPNDTASTSEIQLHARPTLRPYQIRVIADVKAQIGAGRKRILVVAPTGAGKTVIASGLIEDAANQGMSVLFLAHRRELIGQASAKLYAVGVDHGIVQAGFPTRPSAAVQVASISTLHARAIRSKRMELPSADLVIVDEAHHATARSYRTLLDAYPNAIVIGITATPCRSDGRGLGGVFECIVEAPQVAELTRLGFLVPCRVYAPASPDLTGVRVERGDYVERDLAQRMNTASLVGDIPTNWHRLAERRPTVVFATGRGHSVSIRDAFRATGVLAEHIDGTTPLEERDRILRMLSSGAVDVITNAAVLVEGWDCPAASCVVLARPTRQLGLYRQMVGRVLRPAPGKTDAIILDHAGAIFAHGFPDDEIAWTLDPDSRATNKKHAARSEYRAAGLTKCPECSAVRFAGQPCPECGWRPKPKAVSVNVVDGDLAAVARDRTARAPVYSAADKLLFYRQLVWIAQERGYKPGWAAFKHKERFGDWPSVRFAQPIEPTDAVRSWVRSRQIAYARSLERRSA